MAGWDEHKLFGDIKTIYILLFQVLINQDPMKVAIPPGALWSY